MNEPNLFWTVFAAVLTAGMLLIAFVWACLNISRREQAQEPFGTYLSVVVMVFGFALISMMIALDAVPDWLNRALR